MFSGAPSIYSPLISQSSSSRKIRDSFLGEMGAFETSCPLFCPHFFPPSEKGGEQSISPQKKGIAAQTGTNRHKPAQTSTNLVFFQHNFLGEEVIGPLFIVCYSSRPHPCTVVNGWGTLARPPDGNARSGRRLTTGCCQEANAVASALLASYLSLSLLQPHLLPLLQSNFAAAPPPSSPLLLSC